MEEKTLEFKDIFLEVKNEDKNVDTKYVRLLDGISGKFKSGVITAVMGASGAGKSTLFDVLLGRIQNSSKTYGTVLYNGQERTEYDWIHKVSYLTQDDIYFPKFTIFESIMFNLDLYQPYTSKKFKIEFANELLKRANIFEKRLAYIDSLSGGERKRAMIALSMCSDPEVIFMDEPTSGLDSHSALTLINFMKDYAADKNKIVIISLHQPGEALFNLFDEILYLGKGAVFYDGKIKDINNWLQEAGLPKPEGISLAEYLFELHTDTPHHPGIKELKPIVNQIIETNRSKYDDLRREISLEQGLSKGYSELSISFVSMLILVKRFYLNMYRTSGIFKSVILYGLLMLGFIALLDGLSYTGLNKFLLPFSFEDSSLKGIAAYLKTFFNSENKRALSFFLFKSQSYIQCMYIFLVFDFFDQYKILVTDVYEGKFSVLTYLIAYILHDSFVTIYLFSLTLGTVFWSSFRSVINYWYIIYSIGLIFCYIVNYMFLRLIFTTPGEPSKIVSSIFLSLSSLNGFGSLSAITFLIENVFPSFMHFLKYFTALFFFFPQFMLTGIYNYNNWVNIQENVSPVGELDSYCPPPYRFNIFYGEKPESEFKFMAAEKLPYWAFLCLFFLSLTINVGGVYYLFNRQLAPMIRLKLKTKSS